MLFRSLSILSRGRIGDDPHRRGRCHPRILPVRGSAPDQFLRRSDDTCLVGNPELFQDGAEGNGGIGGGDALDEGIQEVEPLIRNNGGDLPAEPSGLDGSIIFQRSAKQARRLLLKLGEEDLRMLIKLECADVKGQNPAFRDDRMALISDFSKILDMVIGASQCFSMRDMAINGNDLIDIGIRQGPEIGRILKKLLDMIIEEEINNDRDILLLKAREIAGKS